MVKDTITIPVKEYNRLKKIDEINKELFKDIERALKDVLAGKVKEV